MSRQSLVGLLIFSGLSIWACLHYRRGAIKAPDHEYLHTCVQRICKVAEALAAYEKRHGRYPDHLETLVKEDYLAEIPVCPAVGSVTYTDYRLAGGGHSFEMSCSGDNHHLCFVGFKGSSNNIPRFNSSQGLIDTPKD